MRADEDEAAEVLRAHIRAAFPDSVFLGSITPSDGRTDEHLDEEQALYRALHGRTWTDIHRQFIASYPDGLALLTDQAFVAFLPAWLVAALADNKVRELLMYFFSSDAHPPSERRDRRIRHLTAAQLDALQGFLAHCVQIEASEAIKKHARSAAAYVARFRGNPGRD